MKYKAEIFHQNDIVLQFSETSIENIIAKIDRINHRLVKFASTCPLFVSIRERDDIIKQFEI